jgi:hypothetical protein
MEIDAVPAEIWPYVIHVPIAEAEAPPTLATLGFGRYPVRSPPRGIANRDSELHDVAVVPLVAIDLTVPHPNIPRSFIAFPPDEVM